METKGDKKLIMVTGDNNNKFYKMHDNGDGTFKVSWGRVGVTEESMDYPIKKWDSIYRNKTGKGYKDVSELLVEKVASDSAFVDVKNAQIAKLVSTLQAFAKKSVTDNYTISADAVTQKQVDEAQAILDRLTTLPPNDSSQLNETLVELYTVIPRRMSNVKKYLFGSDLGMGLSKDNLDRVISNEQATLDVMRGQVSTNSKTKAVSNKTDKTILDAMGLALEPIDDNDHREILRLLGPNARQFKSAYRIVNTKTHERFEKWLKSATNSKTNLLWHGSRNENWWSILDSGLLIRPANAVITGAMFGNGVYFADKAQKSIGYTSLRGSYWASGSANRAYLAIFKVHTGTWLQVQRHEYWMQTLNERALKSKGQYDSLFAMGGYDLRNNEYIVYNTNQSTIHYLVEIGD
jgi:poly [ADP-ribose] polymerase 2/3/4